MLTTVEGTYKDGQVALSETRADLAEGKVLVTFLANGNSKSPDGVLQRNKMMYKGMFPELLQLTDEDFKAAEFHGDPDDGLDWS